MSTSLKKSPESGSTFLNKLFLALLNSVRHDKNCDYDDTCNYPHQKEIILLVQLLIVSVLDSLCVCAKHLQRPGTGKAKDIGLSYFAPWLKTYPCLQFNLPLPWATVKTVVPLQMDWREQEWYHICWGIKNPKNQKGGRVCALMSEEKRVCGGLMHWLMVHPPSTEA